MSPSGQEAFEDMGLLHVALLHVALYQMHFHSPDGMDHHQEWDNAGKWFFSRLRVEKVF